MTDQQRSYRAVMERKEAIMKASVGIDYSRYRRGRLAFDYEGMLADTSLDLKQIEKIQTSTSVGNTPLVELKNISRLVRRLSAPGKGATIFVKDEAANPSGSFKDRRASLSAYIAQERGYPGIAAASSGNYGAAVASQAAKYGLDAIIVQEAFDSRGVEQPEIAEKTRACEAYGAEVQRLSVGPELFYQFLLILEDSSFFNASLYSPYSILGIETLGAEIVRQCRHLRGKDPDMVIATHAGGGNLTGTARGLKKAGAEKCTIVGASVDLSGLHMASDHDFNRKSFTTGHTGFSIPFTTKPDRSDVPRSAARPLRYMDRFVSVSQGEVFYVTQALAELEGMERGPAGNTSLAAAFALARDLDREAVVVVQETEYTGAGKHPYAQLNFAGEQGIELRRGDPKESVPGKQIIIPERPEQIAPREIDLNRMRKRYIENCLKELPDGTHPQEIDLEFLAEECGIDRQSLEVLLSR